jgi:predicted nucleotidyltransferase
MINKGVLSPHEKQAIESLKRGLMSGFNIVEMKLFGSKAREQGSPESDMDIMIELEERDYKLESEI